MTDHHQEHVSADRDTPAFRPVHVMGFGWSGSSAVVELLAGSPDVRRFAVGETCTMCKDVNPQAFQRANPEARLGREGVVHLLTGGRVLGRLPPPRDHTATVGESEGVAAAEFMRSPAGPAVIAHLHAHERYAAVNQNILGHLTFERLLDAVPEESSTSGWTNREVRALLINWAGIGLEPAPWLLFDNDPTLRSWDASDPEDLATFVVVVRSARAQLADFVNRQLITKHKKLPRRSTYRKWVRTQVRMRKGLWRLRRGAVGRPATVAVVRFEEFVKGRMVAEQLLDLLMLDRGVLQQFDFAASQANVEVLVHPLVRIPVWVRAACRLLDVFTLLAAGPAARGVTDRGRRSSLEA